jgi:hypothetical protein
MLEKGASQPWQKTLFEMTGERQIDAIAMMSTSTSRSRRGSRAPFANTPVRGARPPNLPFH